MDENYELDLEELPEKGNVEKAKDYIELIDDLIAGENEAINDYDKAIEMVANSDASDEIKEKAIKVFQHIKEDEMMDHVQKLKELKEEL